MDRRIPDRLLIAVISYKLQYTTGPRQCDAGALCCPYSLFCLYCFCCAPCREIGLFFRFRGYPRLRDRETQLAPDRHHSGSRGKCRLLQHCGNRKSKRPESVSVFRISSDRDPEAHLRNKRCISGGSASMVR